MVTDRARGTIGIDLNADHLAVADTDASGICLLGWRRVHLVTWGTYRHRNQAPIGGAAASVAGYAPEVGKPIVLEKLDFRIKKAVPELESRNYSRMLSSSSYGRARVFCPSRGGLARCMNKHLYNQTQSYQLSPAFGFGICRVELLER